MTAYGRTARPTDPIKRWLPPPSPDASHRSRRSDAPPTVLESVAHGQRAWLVVLSTVCDSHGAGRGKPCWTSPNAVCGERIRRAGFVPPAPLPHRHNRSA